MPLKMAALLALLALGFDQTRASARPGEPAREGGKAAGASQRISFAKTVTPVLQEYCYPCHGNGKKKGGLALDAYKDEGSAFKDRQVWEKVLENLSLHVMPPENKRQPSPAERDLIAQWIEIEILHCDCQHPDPGRVTLRRLNRAEYNNTIRDLVGVDFHPADDFPADDVGYGFDNIGDVLSLPPILIEKYLGAAEKILNRAIVTDRGTTARTNRFSAAALEGTAPGDANAQGMRALVREGDIHFPFEFSRNGEYILRARAYGEQAGPEPARMVFLLDDKEVQRFDVTAELPAPQIYEVRLPLAPGKRKFAAAYLNNYFNAQVPDPKKRDRNLIIDYLEIVVPAATGPVPLPESHQRIFICQPTPETKMECARQIIQHFAQRAYRRPVSPEEVNRLAGFVALAEQEKDSFEQGIKLALQAVLVSPHFLFRGELQPDPTDPAAIHPIDEYALASRLSYFLWSSMPDDELFAEAGRGTLRQNLEAQVRRMLISPKSRALVENFADQWLQIRNLNLVSPAREVFPSFDEELRAAMQKETELFFETIMREDRSLLEFLDARYTFLNERLARHYGISGVKGEAFQRVVFKRRQRGGLLTQASILTITSNPTRTSPVKRGKWVLENILGTPPPPPPPGVPELKEGQAAALTGTLRQRMEQHRANALCASCHARMDPIGFGFENFDGLGAWREKDGNFPIDPAGQLVSGETFKGPADLKAILLKRKKDVFVRCLSEKMLTYALGRGLDYYDKCAVDEICKEVAKRKYKFTSLVLEVVKSTPFEKRRGEAERLAQTAP